MARETESTSRLIYVSGGCRSGKSSFAQSMAESMEGRKVYLATCSRIDTEMDVRIAKHQQQRQGRGWELHEEGVNLTQALMLCKDADVIS
jgi:adenosylcobinamide kinase/adenosylcobinamide-phosphate guanylyltransferase